MKILFNESKIISLKILIFTKVYYLLVREWITYFEFLLIYFAAIQKIADQIFSDLFPFLILKKKINEKFNIELLEFLFY